MSPQKSALSRYMKTTQYNSFGESYNEKTADLIFPKTFSDKFFVPLKTVDWECENTNHKKTTQ